MLFTSLIYLFFLATTVVLYYILPSRFRWILLAVASVGYYLSFIPIFFPILAVLITGNYFLAFRMKQAVTRGNTKTAIITIVLLNLAVLAFFKYFNLLFPNVRVNLWFVDWFYRVDPVIRIIIPIGLSYIIFIVLSHHIESKGTTYSTSTISAIFSTCLFFFL